MAEVTGPIATLPGSRHTLPEGATCDLHPDREAVARVQGETDSFGSEMNDMCTGCLAEFAARKVDTSGKCDWCKTPVATRYKRRCSDEGLYGPLYDVCSKCVEKQETALQKELADFNERYGPLDCGGAFYDEDDF